MESFFQILSNFGFPVAVASYLLFRFEKKLDNLVTTNLNLVLTNDKLVKEIKSLRKEIEELKKK